MVRAPLVMAAPVVAAVLLGACSPEPPAAGPAGGIAVADVMGGGGAEGFAQATEVREFVFPEDHGAHEEFRTEWWYFTGNLDDDDGGEFGFQLTIFRHALMPVAPQRDSRWASRDVWFAHLALGDGARQSFTAFERFQRGAQDLAGARARPFAVWVGDWRAESIEGGEPFPMRLSAGADDIALELTVNLHKPLVLQGDRGLSRKGPEPGNASYYYSATRLAAHGTLTVDGTEHSVSGWAWLDREWSTSALSAAQTGWDWFAIQLDDGRELMLYRLRRADGTTDPHNSGILVSADGTTRRLGPEDVRYEPGRTWVSPVSGASYPVEWRLSVVPLDLELEVIPMLEASELDVAVRYWEGAIRVRGRDGEGTISGRGFLEMTGYETPASERIPNRPSSATDSRDPG